MKYLARVLGVLVLLQDEHTTMSASYPWNEAIFENVQKHHSSHADRMEWNCAHFVGEMCTHNVQCVASLTMRTTNINNSIGSKQAEFELVCPDYLHLLLVNPLYIVFTEKYSRSTVLVRNERLEHWYSGS